MKKLKGKWITKNFIVRLLHPKHISKYLKLSKKKQISSRADFDAQLKLYSQILPGDFLHYGFFEDPNIQAEKISLEDKGEIFNMLAFNSSDATFPGYPYGLLDADKLARVDFNERENQKIQFLSCASKEKVLSRLIKCLKSTDAHDVLNQLIGG